VTAAGAPGERWRDEPQDVAVLLYTSGTTAAPKAAVLRHRHLTSYVLESIEFLSAGSDEAALVSVPPYHIAGLANLLSNLFAGRTIAYLESFTAANWLEAVEAERRDPCDGRSDDVGEDRRGS